ncbi:hypothetical protein [Nocardia brasiliensis]|uniref:hypothetical protein n=1 Tax=Nocardia brasiliensis TaxID=37326 RepID=UPI00245872A2|nr:hypothetical protein [Nocardia brasiliensis]
MRYPIVDQRYLDAVPKRALRRRSRELQDLPRPSAHQVLVYRVNGEFFVDKGDFKLTHRRVLDASHVSLVDMSLHAPVVVEIVIPAADAVTFTVQVTFECTVTDPIPVVQHGRADARWFLESYLRANNSIFELAENQTYSDIKIVRRRLNSWLLSESVENPPIEPGMDIRISSIEVLLPAELANFERQRRELWRSTILATERAGLVHSLASKLENQSHEILHTRQQHEQTLSADMRRFHLTELEQHLRKMSSGPQGALHLALIRGDITAIEFANRMRDETDREETRRREAAQHALAEYVGVLKEWFSRGGADYVNVDPDKLDGLLNRLIDDATAAIQLLPLDERLEEIEVGPADDGDDDAD